jgi:hypothetical protein
MHCANGSADVIRRDVDVMLEVRNRPPRPVMHGLLPKRLNDAVLDSVTNHRKLALEILNDERKGKDFAKLNIEAEGAHELARELAKRRGTTLTQAVTAALSEALDHSMPPAVAKLERLREISYGAAGLPVLDGRTPDDILGHDDKGMPSCR